MTLLMCTLYQGEPHGLALIECTHPEYEWFSFKGMGVFNQGKLNSGPFICVSEYGSRYLFASMKNGRPEQDSNCT